MNVKGVQYFHSGTMLLRPVAPPLPDARLLREFPACEIIRAIL